MVVGAGEGPRGFSVAAEGSGAYQSCVNRALTTLLTAGWIGLPSGWSQEALPPPAVSPKPVPAVEEQAKRPAASLEEAERLFLNGTLSARELQQQIAAFHAARTSAKPKADAVVGEEAIKVLRQSDPDPAKNPPPGPAVKPAQLQQLSGGESLTNHSADEDFAEIESKMDELLRQQRDRERQMSNRVSSAKEAPTKPLSKRERLDAILRLHIEGELSEEEYKRQRSAIISEKESE